MFRRRRPLLRAAVVGGGAYVAGKRVARGRADQDSQDAQQDDRIGDLEQQQQGTGSPAPAAAPAAESSMADQLGQLADLHQQGILTDDEFAAAKAKLLAT
jgi:membrane protease subunit (stomatin/prohibitin family)